MRDDPGYAEWEQQAQGDADRQAEADSAAAKAEGLAEEQEELWKQNQRLQERVKALESENEQLASDQELAIDQCQEMKRRVKELGELLAEGVSLLGDFAGSYLSEDGTEVIETRGNGKRLADFWPKALAAIAQAEREEKHGQAPLSPSAS